MISNNGKLHVKRYMAGYVPAIAQSVAVGIGNSAESASDYKLQFEASRTDVSLTSFDFVNDRLVFKAPLPEEFGGTVYEVALFSTLANNVAGDYGSRVITTFDESTEEWYNNANQAEGTYVAGTSRIGDTNLSVAAAASTTTTMALGDLALDLSGYSGADIFSFAYNVTNAFVADIKVQFLTDSSNYYTISLGAQTAGYKIVDKAKSTATATGSPDWGSIIEMRVLVTSTSGGTGTVHFDGVRIEDFDTDNPDYVMVARKVLAVPYVKQPGKIQELEFALEVNV